MSTPNEITKTDRLLGGLWGSLIGDALGVPVEFIDRASLGRIISRAAHGPTTGQ